LKEPNLSASFSSELAQCSWTDCGIFCGTCQKSAY